MIRIPAPGRIENRCVDGAANPYLASAVLLAAGLDGMEKETDPGRRNNENLYDLTEAELAERGIDYLPATLRDACDALEEDEVIREALGLEYAGYYLECKREEWRSYHQSVSDWERDTYLSVF